MKGGTQFPGRQMTAEGAENSQQYHKYCLRYKTCAFGRPQVRTWGRQTCILPRAPSNLVLRPCRIHSCEVTAALAASGVVYDQARRVLRSLEGKRQRGELR